MTTLQIFGLQFLLSLVVYGLIARWYLAPRLAALPLPSALSLLLFLHAFRHLGMVFLVPTVVGPSLEPAFAVPAAYGDLLAALLAPPVATLIGFTLASIEPGRAVVEFEATERHANPMGTLHGGVLCDVADAAMGMAWASTLDAGETFTTLELKINFLKPFWTGKLTATGRVVQGGRTIGLVECDVVDDKKRLVARASSTVMTLRGEAAAGR